MAIQDGLHSLIQGDPAVQLSAQRPKDWNGSGTEGLNPPRSRGPTSEGREGGAPRRGGERRRRGKGRVPYCRAPGTTQGTSHSQLGLRSPTPTTPMQR